MSGMKPIEGSEGLAGYHQQTEYELINDAYDPLIRQLQDMEKLLRDDPFVSSDVCRILRKAWMDIQDDKKIYAKEIK